MLHNLTRRGFLASTATGVVLAQIPVGAKARYEVENDSFPYEVRRTDREWLDRLGAESFAVMRRGGTEEAKSHPLWESTEPGVYSCKGCDLPLYDATWKVVLDIGWLFFRHGFENAFLTGIDRPEPGEDDKDVTAEQLDQLAMLEVHCRRCGSHLGHIVSEQNRVLHCVNGSAMNFAPAAG